MEVNKSLDLFNPQGNTGRQTQNDWQKVVAKARMDFEKALAPLEEEFFGIAALLKGHFAQLKDAQQVLVAENWKQANAKMNLSGKGLAKPLESRTLVEIISHSADESDPYIRNLWANMIAHELSGKKVHPEFATVLRKMTREDFASLEAMIQAMQEKATKKTLKQVLHSVAPVRIGAELLGKIVLDFHNEILGRLGIAKNVDGLWSLTKMGEAFLEIVAEPGMEKG